MHASTSLELLRAAFLIVGVLTALTASAEEPDTAPVELACPTKILVPQDIPAIILVNSNGAAGYPHIDYCGGFFVGWQMFLDDFAHRRIDPAKITLDDWRRVEASSLWFKARGRKDGYEACRERVNKLLTSHERTDAEELARKSIRSDSLPSEDDALKVAVRPPSRVNVPEEIKLWRIGELDSLLFDYADYVHHYVDGWCDCLEDYGSGQDLEKGTWANSRRKVEERAQQSGSSGKGRLSDEKPGTAGYEACRENLRELQNVHGDKRLRQIVQRR